MPAATLVRLLRVPSRAFYFLPFFLMASDEPSVSDAVAGSPARLYRISYVDTVVRETFVNACDENEAEDIVEAQIADARHHHAIDAYHDDVQAEAVDGIGRRPTCFECGGSSE